MCEETERFRSIKYSVDSLHRSATITLSRPSHLNAIDEWMPSEIRKAGQKHISIQRDREREREKREEKEKEKKKETGREKDKGRE